MHCFGINRSWQLPISPDFKLMRKSSKIGNNINTIRNKRIYLLDGLRAFSFNNSQFFHPKAQGAGFQVKDFGGTAFSCYPPIELVVRITRVASPILEIS
jgi:hypothetical protein